MRNISGFKEDVAPFVYLGVRIIRVKPGKLVLHVLSDRAVSNLSSWKAKVLSMAGRA